MRARARTLTAHEIAVARRGATLPARHAIRVHAQAHRAARLAPLKARVGEDDIQPLDLRLTLNEARARHNQRLLDAFSDPLPLEHSRRRTQILNAAVGATADEDMLNAHIFHALTSRQPHIIQ